MQGLEKFIRERDGTKVQKWRNQPVLGTQEAMLGVFKLKAVGVGDWPGEDKVAGTGKGRHWFSNVDGLWGWSE